MIVKIKPKQNIHQFNVNRNERRREDIIYGEDWKLEPSHRMASQIQYKIRETDSFH
jgi:hypothetical protein